MSPTKNTLIIGVVFLAVGSLFSESGLAECQDNIAKISSISMKVLKEIYQSLGADEVILDVRTREEYLAGHVPGAINIPHTEVENYVSELSKYKTIYVHCKSGKRAKIAIEALAKRGLNNLVLVKDSGMADWIGQH